jgi:hypothetical protein
MSSGAPLAFAMTRAASGNCRFSSGGLSPRIKTFSSRPIASEKALLFLPRPEPLDRIGLHVNWFPHVLLRELRTDRMAPW